MAIGRIINPVMPQVGSLPSLGEVAKGAGNQSPFGEFGDLVANGVRSVNNNVKEFENLSESFAKGEKVNVQELMLTGERADISLKLMVTLRNKALEAYQEIMRLPI